MACLGEVSFLGVFGSESGSVLAVVVWGTADVSTPIEIEDVEVALVEVEVELAEYCDMVLSVAVGSTSSLSFPKTKVSVLDESMDSPKSFSLQLWKSILCPFSVVLTLIFQSPTPFSPQCATDMNVQSLNPSDETSLGLTTPRFEIIPAGDIKSTVVVPLISVSISTVTVTCSILLKLAS